MSNSVKKFQRRLGCDVGMIDYKKFDMNRVVFHGPYAGNKQGTRIVDILYRHEDTAKCGHEPCEVHILGPVNNTPYGVDYYGKDPGPYKVTCPVRLDGDGDDPDYLKFLEDFDKFILAKVAENCQTWLLKPKGSVTSEMLLMSSMYHGFVRRTAGKEISDPETGMPTIGPLGPPTFRPRVPGQVDKLARLENGDPDLRPRPFGYIVRDDQEPSQHVSFADLGLWKNCKGTMLWEPTTIVISGGTGISVSADVCNVRFCDRKEAGTGRARANFDLPLPASMIRKRAADESSSSSSCSTDAKRARDDGMAAAAAAAAAPLSPSGAF